MGRARVIARAETWGQFYTREKLVALIHRLEEEGLTPIYDELARRPTEGRVKTKNPPLDTQRRPRPVDILFGATDG